MPNIFELIPEHWQEIPSHSYKGRQRKYNCPKCHCSGNRFYVEAQRDSFACFDCGIRGGVVEFIGITRDLTPEKAAVAAAHWGKV